MGLYRKYDYAIGYSGHLIDEYEYYVTYFKYLFKRISPINIKIIDNANGGLTKVEYDCCDQKTDSPSNLPSFIKVIIHPKLPPK